MVWFSGWLCSLGDAYTAGLPTYRAQYIETLEYTLEYMLEGPAACRKYLQVGGQAIFQQQ